MRFIRQGRLTQRQLAAVALVVGMLLLIVLRNHYLASDLTINPDEAELLAAGRRAKMDLLPFQTYTTPTYLYLWPIFLGILGRIGIPLTLPTAHVLSALTYLFMMFTGWYLSQRHLGWKVSTLLVGPTAVAIFAALGGSDFLEMGTELLPIAILMAAAWIIFPAHGDITEWRLALGSAVAAASIWAKPQVGPLALAMVVSSALLMDLERRRHDRSAEGGHNLLRLVRPLTVAAAGFITATLLLTLVVVASGTFTAFRREALELLFGYLGTSNSTTTPFLTFTNAPPLVRLAGVGVFVTAFPFALLLYAAGLWGWSGRLSRLSRGERSLAVIAWVLPLIATLGSFLSLSEVYTHYANILYAAATVAVIVGSRLARLTASEVTPDARRQVALFMTIPAVLLVLAVLSGLSPGFTFVRTEVDSVVSRGTPAATDAFTSAGSQLGTWCPSGSDVLVWGWSAQYYAYFDWVPASRYVTAYWQLFGVGDTKYYKATLQHELEESPPRCIMEAIGPSFFGDIPATDTLAQVLPGVKPLLSACYATRRTEAGTILSQAAVGPTVSVLVRERRCHN